MKLKRIYTDSFLLFLLCATSMQAQKIKVEYDKKTDFSQYKTYSWMKLGAAEYPFVRMDTVGAIDDQLVAKGLKKVPTGGDLIVNGFGSWTDSMNVSYDVDVYAMPGLDGPINWADGTPRPGNSSSVYVDKGTLVVDIVDRKAKQIKWRGTAKADVDPSQAEKSMEIIEKAVAKMIKDYPGPH
jgi:hypothetical protein